MTDLSRVLAGAAGEVDTCTGANARLSDDLCRHAFEPVGAKDRLIDGSRREYGYGWETRPFGNEILIGHNGATSLSSGCIGFPRDYRIGIADPTIGIPIVFGGL